MLDYDYMKGKLSFIHFFMVNETLSAFANLRMKTISNHWTNLFRHDAICSMFLTNDSLFLYSSLKKKTTNPALNIFKTFRNTVKLWTNSSKFYSTARMLSSLIFLQTWAYRAGGGGSPPQNVGQTWPVGQYSFESR